MSTILKYAYNKSCANDGKFIINKGRVICDDKNFQRSSLNHKNYSMEKTILVEM